MEKNKKRAFHVIVVPPLAFNRISFPFFALVQPRPIPQRDAEYHHFCGVRLWGHSLKTAVDIRLFGAKMSACVQQLSIIQVRSVDPDLLSCFHLHFYIQRYGHLNQFLLLRTTYFRHIQLAPVCFEVVRQI